ncbi:MAG: hypothetical protein HYY32_01830 [Chloroflexi bacterium]|nr:hypothetical protein [Chloroflexota bacterium]
MKERPGLRQMTHNERVGETLRGRATDRVPVSMWRHFFARETSPEGLAEAMLAYQEEFDWDFMKVNPRASYHVEDWGVRTKYHGDAPPAVVEFPIGIPEDWKRIRVLDTRRGVLGEHLKALEMITSRLRGSLPVLMTIFNPISVASRLAPSEEVFLKHLREDRDKLVPAMEAITATFAAFSAACIERGVSGLFFATTAWATTARLSEQEYAEFARPFDLKLLAALPAAEFHILHVCHDHNMLRSLSDYPVHAFNWDCLAAGNASLPEGKNIVRGKAVIGGVPIGKALIDAQPAEITRQLRALHGAAGTTGWMLGTGCTYDPSTPAANVRAVRDAVGP